MASPDRPQSVADRLNLFASDAWDGAPRDALADVSLEVRHRDADAEKSVDRERDARETDDAQLAVRVAGQSAGLGERQLAVRAGAAQGPELCTPGAGRSAEQSFAAPEELAADELAARTLVSEELPVEAMQFVPELLVRWLVQRERQDAMRLGVPEPLPAEHSRARQVQLVA